MAAAWDAERYEQVASPQQAWAREIIARASLTPGGRLVAQCGGPGNLAKVLEQIGDRSEPHHFATAEDTEVRLRRAGFTHARAWIEEKPTHVDDMETYIATVMLHGQPGAAATARRAAAKLDHLDYVRLNIDAVA